MKNHWLNNKNNIYGIILGASVCSTGYALDLGEMKVRSQPGEPFDARIRILELSPSVTEVSIHLTTEEEKGDDTQTKKLKKIPIERNKGKSYIRISSEDSVDEDVIHFYLTVETGNARVVREYVVIEENDYTYSAHAKPSVIELERYEKARPQIVLPLPVIALRAPEKVEESEEEVTPVVTPVRQEERPRETRRPAQSYHQMRYKVEEGDNLWIIAKHAQKQNPGSTFYQVLAALYEANPNAFINNNVNQLRPGVTLEMPNATVLAQVDANAINQVRAQMAAYSKGEIQSVNSAELSEPAVPAETNMQPPKTAQAAELKILTPKNEAAIEGEASNTNDSLALVNEELAQAQRENESLQSRVQSLQEQIDTMEQVLELREGTATENTSATRIQEARWKIIFQLIKRVERLQKKKPPQASLLALQVRRQLAIYGKTSRSVNGLII